MSKYKARINKLVAKTHDFVSHHDLCLMKDFIKSRLDETEKPHDFEKQYRDYKKILERHKNADIATLKKVIAEMTKTSPALSRKSLYEYLVEECEKHPNGVWLPKNQSGKFMKIMEYAKQDLKAKKSNG